MALMEGTGQAASAARSVAAWYTIAVTSGRCASEEQVTSTSQYTQRASK